MARFVKNTRVLIVYVGVDVFGKYTHIIFDRVVIRITFKRTSGRPDLKQRDSGTMGVVFLKLAPYFSRTITSCVFFGPIADDFYEF